MIIKLINKINNNNEKEINHNTNKYRQISEYLNQINYTIHKRSIVKHRVYVIPKIHLPKFLN